MDILGFLGIIGLIAGGIGVYFYINMYQPAMRFLDTQNLREKYELWKVNEEIKRTIAKEKVEKVRNSYNKKNKNWSK